MPSSPLFLDLHPLIISFLISSPEKIQTHRLVCKSWRDVIETIYGKDNLYDSIKKGNFIPLLLALRNKQDIDFDKGLYGACKGGCLPIVLLMIEKGATDFSYGLRGACFGGHLSIVNLMIEKGANNFNGALRIAKEYNYPEIIEYLSEILQKQSYS